MREIRPSGSEGGASFKPWSLPLSGWCDRGWAWCGRESGIGGLNRRARRLRSVVSCGARGEHPDQGKARGCDEVTLHSGTAHPRA
jgi:hypothetical protein